MKKISCSFCGLLLFFATTSVAQNPQLPKNINQPKQVIVPTKPLIKKDTVKYVAVPNTVTANSRIATADELFMQNGSFAIRIANDYRYLTLFTPTPAEGAKAVVWEYVSEPGQNLWKLVPQPDGYYKIRTQSGLFLEVINNEREHYYELKTYQGDNRRYPDNQLFRLEDLTGGLFRITSKSGYVLSLLSTSRRDGADITVINRTDPRYEQRWQLIKMEGDSRRVTTFNPQVSGFRFINTFNGEDVIRWGGLCGGMVYSALDYFRNGIPVPRQSFTPANATPLQSYIYQRQQHSMWNVNEKWSELEVAYNTRAGEIFRWGLQGSGGGRLEELKNAINAGRSVPIGLFVGGVAGINGAVGGNHVVLAIGYSTGRYNGDLTGHPEDLKIFVYDPNQGNRLMTFVPNIEGQCFFEVEKGKVWRTYFVNNKYDNDHVPPGDIPNFPENEPEGSIRNLYFTFLTGGDDLRGNNDNVGITVHYTDGTTQAFGNVNGLARWVDNSTQTVHLALNRPVSRASISNFTLTTTFGDAYDSDDWNLDGYRISSAGIGGVIFAENYSTPGTYLFRFSGDQHLQRFGIPVTH